MVPYGPLNGPIWSHRAISKVLNLGKSGSPRGPDFEFAWTDVVRTCRTGERNVGGEEPEPLGSVAGTNKKTSALKRML